jgi:uncharacterized protein
MVRTYQRMRDSGKAGSARRRDRDSELCRSKHRHKRRRRRGMFVWWGSQVECVSSLARLERIGSLAEHDVTVALSRLAHLARTWDEVDPSDTIKELAARLLRVHPLRAADALQLAAAFVASEYRPASSAIVTLDDRLATAARKRLCRNRWVSADDEPAHGCSLLGPVWE